MAGWQGEGSERDLSRPETGWGIAELARQGLVVVCVDYRLSAPGEPSWPGNLDDVREAVRWIRRHSSDYGIDPDRLAVLGASAGGHLALMLGALPVDKSSQVNAVIDFYGPTDLRALAALRTPADRALELLLGGSPAMVGVGYDAASPVRHVAAGGPPVLIVHGKDDFLVPLAQSQGLAEALARVGVPHRLITLEGSRHGFGLRPASKDLVPEILAFLEVSGGGSSGVTAPRVGEQAGKKRDRGPPTGRQVKIWAERSICDKESLRFCR